MAHRKRKRLLMTPEERAAHELRSAETDRLLKAQIAYYRHLSAERKECRERRERSLFGRLGRRLGLGPG